MPPFLSLFEKKLLRKACNQHLRAAIVAYDAVSCMAQLILQNATLYWWRLMKSSTYPKHRQSFIKQLVFWSALLGLRAQGASTSSAVSLGRSCKRQAPGKTLPEFASFIPTFLLFAPPCDCPWPGSWITIVQHAALGANVRNRQLCTRTLRYHRCLLLDTTTRKQANSSKPAAEQGAKYVQTGKRTRRKIASK